MPEEDKRQAKFGLWRRRPRPWAHNAKLHDEAAALTFILLLQVTTIAGVEI